MTTNKTKTPSFEDFKKLVSEEPRLKDYNWVFTDLTSIKYGVPYYQAVINNGNTIISYWVHWAFYFSDLEVIFEEAPSLDKVLSLVPTYCFSIMNSKIPSPVDVSFEGFKKFIIEEPRLEGYKWIFTDLAPGKEVVYYECRTEDYGVLIIYWSKSWTFSLETSPRIYEEAASLKEVLDLVTTDAYIISPGMRDDKKKDLEKKGWETGTVAEFLELTPEENELVETKLVANNASTKVADLLTEIVARKHKLVSKINRLSQYQKQLEQLECLIREELDSDYYMDFQEDN